MIWNPSEGINLGFFTIHYYSLMFVVAFSLGWYIMKHIFIRENQSLEKLDTLFVWTVLATLVGARLGHVFFYQRELLSQDFLSVFLPFRTKPHFEFTGFQGLASHGAAIAIIATMYFYSKKVIQKPILWVLDRVVIPVASGAIFVRIGNFFNSEIYGHITHKSSFLATKFVREDEFWQSHDLKGLTNINDTQKAFEALTTNPKFAPIVEQIPYRFPAQLYESLSYIFVFAILFYLYWKTNAREKQGFLFGLFLVLLWTVRFLVEFVKESQGGDIEKWFDGLFTTGQWLSIPFIIIGFYFVLKAKKE